MPKKNKVDDDLAILIADPNTPLEMKVKLLEMRVDMEKERRQNHHERVIQRLKDKPGKRTEEKRELAREKMEEPTIPLGDRVQSILERMKSEEVTQ